MYTQYITVFIKGSDPNNYGLTDYGLVNAPVTI